MPYSLRGNQPGCSGWAVVNTTTGQTITCHPTKKKALAHLRALYKNIGDGTMQDLALNVQFPDAPGGMMQIGASGPEDTDQQLDDIAAAANPDKNRGNAETLRRYWSEGEGAAKIRFGTPGDHERCVRQLVEHAKFTEDQAHGYCQLLEKRVTGLYTSQHAQLEKGKHAAAEPPPHLPALVTIPGVDILAAGTWQLSTGRQTFTRQDLQSAIEAAACPAVGSPLIKIGHLDPRFASAPDHDGEPAIGKVTNMRLNDGGTKITGDLAGMPGWLAGIAASAFPRRSVEGKYGFTCQIGHQHPFVVTALALLGVTPPGVGVLSGLDDIAALYGVQAAGENDVGAAGQGQPYTGPRYYLVKGGLSTNHPQTGEPTGKVTRDDIHTVGTGWYRDKKIASKQADAYDKNGVLFVRVVPAKSKAEAISKVRDEELARLRHNGLLDESGGGDFEHLHPRDPHTGEWIHKAAGEEWHTEPIEPEEGPVVAVTEEDVRRAYYAAGVPHTRWITELQMAPTQLIVADDADSKLYRVPFSIEAEAVSFGDPEEIDSYADVAAARGTGTIVAWASAAESRAVIAAWDAAAAQRNLGDNPSPGAIKALYAIPGGTKSASKLPHHDVSSDGKVGAANPQACSAAMGALNGARGGLTGVSDAQVAAARAHIMAHMRSMGMPGAQTAAAAEDEQDLEAAAGDGHGPYTGEHAHPHTANGDQGGDQTHDHMHRHDGDGVHAHAHDPVSAAPTASTQEEGGSEEMEFTTEQLAAIRAKLGKNDGEEVTPAEIAAAFTDAPTVAASGGPLPKPHEELGVYLVEASVLHEWQKAAEAGERASTELRHSQREEILAAAIRDGKIPQSRIDHWRRAWEADEEYTRSQLEHLAKGFVPTGPAIGAAGLDPDLPGGFEEQMTYKQLYGAEEGIGVRRG